MYRKKVNRRVSYFLLIMHEICRRRNAKVGVIMIDLGRTFEVSKYRIFFSRGG